MTTDRYTGFTRSGVRILAKDFPKFREMINSVSDEDMKEEEPSPEEEEAPNGEEKDEGKEKGQKELPDY